MPAPNKHAFQEFDDRSHQQAAGREVDLLGRRRSGRCTRGWRSCLPNGNTLANYGTGGVIREITPDKKTVFYVKFDVTTGDDFFNKMVGNNVLINDLYALNGGGPK